MELRETMNKYRNIKTQYRGIKFDSRKEMMRYIELESMQRKGLISFLQCQVKMDVAIDGKHICYLIVDFVYMIMGITHYEDVKAFNGKKFLTTPVFNLKKKLVEAIHGIKIELI